MAENKVASSPGMNETLQARVDWVWRQTLMVFLRAPEIRLASSLSPIELFVSLYYGGLLRFNPERPYMEERDRCIISKGHGSICMYPILADLGYFSASELERVCQTGSFLGGIPDPVIPGYETVNGSLGHGLGVGSGMALGLKVKGGDQDVFVVTGDGELHEGANWEAIMFAAQNRLDNLHLLVDDNQICMLGYTKDINSQSSLSARLSSFGWDCVEVDGHDVMAVHANMARLKETRGGRPKALVARTIKGRGVPGLENAPLSHVMSPRAEVVESLLRECRS